MPSPALPEPPVKCVMSGWSLDAVQVTCKPGRSVIAQNFRLKVFQARTRRVFIALNSSSP